LGNSKDSQAFEPLIKALGDQDRNLRREAAKALARWAMYAQLSR
jgi:HEAT repeat protein